MRDFFTTLPRNALSLFSGANIFWHVSAIMLTALLVYSGFDWWWFEATRNATLLSALLSAALLGFVMPFAVPLVLVLIGIHKKDRSYFTLAAAVAQAVVLAYLLSILYKTFTGRVHPEVTLLTNLSDLSRDFQFGILRGGIFWGWPSSHATIAFAMATTLYHLVPNKKARIAFFVYAFYIGISIATTIHWFSEFAAGAIFGTLVGIVVARSFLKLLPPRQTDTF